METVIGRGCFDLEMGRNGGCACVTAVRRAKIVELVLIESGG